MSIENRIELVEAMTLRHDADLAGIRMELGIFTPPLRDVEAHILQLNAAFRRFAVDTTQSFAEINGRLGNLEEDVATLKSDVATLKSDMAEVKTMLRTLLER